MVLQVQSLTKLYSTATGVITALREVSFTLAEGRSCAVLGPSGSGKTTLLALCAGLDRPSSGEVFIEGVRLGSLGEEELARIRRERIGFIFQNFQLISSLTALENVMIPLELQRQPDPATRAQEALERVGLRDRSRHYPIQLSGGEQQRVAIARALVGRPRLLFADEPTGNLDSENGHHIADLLFELTREAKTALLLVTHNREFAARADELLLLQAQDRENGART